MTTEPAIPVDAVIALSTHLLEDGDLDQALRHVCTATVAHVPGADEASVTLIAEGRGVTYGATSGLPLAADERQYEHGSGPCLDAGRANQTFVVDDAATDLRWGDLLPTMAAEGIGCTMSVPLPVQDAAIGGLNIYGRRPGAFDDDSRAIAERLASFAAVAVANAVSYSKVAQDAENMRAAMASRAVIEQAKGIIMARVGCDADAAIAVLIEQSQHENRKLRDIAAELVERASRPTV